MIDCLLLIPAEKKSSPCFFHLILTRTCRVRGHHALKAKMANSQGYKMHVLRRGNDDAIRVQLGPMGPRLELTDCQTGRSLGFAAGFLGRGGLLLPRCRSQAFPRFRYFTDRILLCDLLSWIVTARVHSHRIASSLLFRRSAQECCVIRLSRRLSGDNKVHGNSIFRSRTAETIM